MKYLIGSRQSGISTDLLLEANRSGATIVVMNEGMKHLYTEAARKFNIFPPDVITVSQIMNGKLRGAKCKHIVIDNLDLFLEKILGDYGANDVIIDTVGTNVSLFN